MSPAFSPGQWVIDTKRKTAPMVFAVIEGIDIAYVLEDDDGDLYLEKESVLIPYDKYYFD